MVYTKTISVSVKRDGIYRAASGPYDGGANEKRHLKKKINPHFFYKNYFAIIWTISICIMWLNYSGAECVGTAFKFR